MTGRSIPRRGTTIRVATPVVVNVALGVLVGRSVGLGAAEAVGLGASDGRLVWLSASKDDDVRSACAGEATAPGGASVCAWHAANASDRTKMARRRCTVVAGP